MAWEIETVFDLDEASLLAEMVAVDLGLFMWDLVIEGQDGYDQYQDNLASYTVPEGATEFAQVQFDQSVDPMPLWEDIKVRFFNYAKAEHQVEFDGLDMYRVLEELLPGQLTGMFNRCCWLESDIEPTELKPTWAEMKAKWDEIKTLNSKKAIVAAAYKTMSDNIGLAVYNLFETTDDASANAFAQSWKIKTERSADYAAEGLVARKEVAGFLIGDPLDTEAKILSYYTEMINLMVVFDKYRDAEIMTYLVAKAAQGL